MVSHLLFLGNLGVGEWVLILLVVLLLFGGRKIPELMRGLGKGIREFNDAKTNVKREIEEGMNDKDRSPNTNSTGPAATTTTTTTTQQP